MNKIYELVYGIAQYAVLDGNAPIELYRLAMIINSTSLICGNPLIYYTVDPKKSNPTKRCAGTAQVVRWAYAYVKKRYGQNNADVIRQAFTYNNGTPVIP